MTNEKNSSMLPILKLFDKFKQKYNKINFDIVHEELVQNDVNYHMNIKIYDKLNLFMLFSDDVSSSLHHTDNLINELIRDTKLCIIDKTTLTPILTWYNKDIIDDDAINIIENNDWNFINFHKCLVYEKRCCLANINNIWCLIVSNEIFILNINNIHDNNSNISQIFLNIVENKINWNNLNKNLCYHFIITHPSFRHIGLYINDESNITHLFTTVKNTLEIYDHKFYHINKISNIQFSCLDEVLTSLEQINIQDVSNKFLSTIGYTVCLYNENSKNYTFLKLRTELFKKIALNTPNHVNQHWNYLEMYQTDKLNNVLPYIHKYHFDIVKRINIAIKTLSKEILNIYHSTRKKQHKELYEILTPIYKKILYELHHIYVEQKYEEYIVKKSDELKEKKSITVNVVYSYIKNLQPSCLRQLIFDRKSIKSKHEELNNTIDNDIDLLILTELLS